MHCIVLFKNILVCKYVERHKQCSGVGVGGLGVLSYQNFQNCMLLIFYFTDNRVSVILPVCDTACMFEFIILLVLPMFQ